MEVINIHIKAYRNRSYSITIGSDLFPRIASETKRLTGAHTYIIVTDSNVERLYGEPLLDSLRAEGLVARLISFPAGERYKTRETKAQVEDAMLKFKAGRDSALIALGGGVVGDLAGFVAATYLRGIPYVQVPTTLVAAVDSSVGGKTAVDTPQGKNLIGAFHQPAAVFIDVSTIRTLPQQEVCGGLAEVIKYGVIKDASLFYYLEENISRVLELDTEAITYIIKRSCEIKGQVVEQDEREENLRKILNFGHTVGHAIENLFGYSMIHGEAISIGMAYEGRLALELGLWKEEELRRLTALIRKARLPLKPPQKVNPDELLEIMRLDKKSRKERIEMALPKAIGEMATRRGSYGIRVEEETIRRVLAS